jgi:hypothetical protein
MVARFELSLDPMDDGQVICRSKCIATPKGGQKMRAYQYACIVVRLGRCCGVWECQTGILHWETCKLQTRVIIRDVLVKESWKEGVRNCFLHLGELVTDIRDDSLDKLPFVLQRSLQAGIGCLRIILGRRG